MDAPAPLARQRLRARRSAGASLGDVAAAVGGTLLGERSIRVLDVTHDSRVVEPGDLFAARKGRAADGLAFVGQALERGAVAILAEREHAPARCAAPVVLVPDIRVAMARAAELLCGNPSDALAVFGITGTNGKTTTAWLVQHVLQAQGARPGVMGTFGASFGGRSFDTGFNTPEADELARIAAWMAEAGATHLLMEMTSIALDQRRTDGLRVRVGAFTNLTQDHLDYHVSMEHYGRAKARLLLDLAPEWAVVTVDDEMGQRLAAEARAKVIRVSRHAGARADVRPIHVARNDLGGLEVEVATPSGPVRVLSPLFGQHNLSNVLLAIGSCLALGVPAHDAASAIASAPSPPGRLERCHGLGDDIEVWVDYAHTPDGLQQVLGALRPLVRGRILCVFGCGGDRDTTKRGPMGRAAGLGSDVAIVTSDNPRRESARDIADAVRAGMGGAKAEVHVELDRAEAIGLAVAMARRGDAVLVAGKGHETTQVIGDRSMPFDDREHAREALRRRRAQRP